MDRPRHGVAQALPRRRIELLKIVETEASPATGGNPQGDLRRLDQECAAAAHRVVEGHVRIPADQMQDSGGEVFANRRGDLRHAVAAFEQCLAGCVEIQGGGGRVEIGVDANVRAQLGNIGACAGAFPQAVANAILDREGSELQALEGAPGCDQIDAQGAVRIEIPLPVGGMGECMEVLLGFVRALRDAPQHATGDAGAQVDPIHCLLRSPEGHAAASHLRGRHPHSTQFGGQDILEATRAGREKVFVHGLRPRARAAETPVGPDPRTIRSERQKSARRTPAWRSPAQ